MLPATQLLASIPQQTRRHVYRRSQEGRWHTTKMARSRQAGPSAADFTHSGYQDIVKTNFSDDTPTLLISTAATTTLTMSHTAVARQDQDMAGMRSAF